MAVGVGVISSGCRVGSGNGVGQGVGLGVGGGLPTGGAALSSVPGRISTAVLLVLLGMLLFSGIGCEPGANITYVNNTTHKVRVYKTNRHFVADLNPYQERTFSTHEDLWTGGIVAETEDGRVAFTISLTWDQLKAQGYRIVIEEQAIPSPTAPTPSPQASPAGQ